MKMHLHRISLQCVVEVRWPGAGTQLVAEYTILWSGVNDKKHRQGVAMVDQKQISNTFQECEAINEIFYCYIHLQSYKTIRNYLLCTYIGCRHR